VLYCEQDRVRQRGRHSAWRAEDGLDRAAVRVSYWDIAFEHPVCSGNNGDFRALKRSDFPSLSQLRRSRIYALWFGPVGVERELNVAIPSPPWLTKTFLFQRRRGRDFTERGRLVLDLLQPHLGRLWRASQTRRRLSAAIAGLDWASSHHPRGVILLAPDGRRIEFASLPARRVMREHFGASQHEAELPPALAR
jgi:hypothetical protein